MGAITITAADGYALSGQLVGPADPRLAVLVSSGTGFPKEYYRRFAGWLADQGAAVLTYDYRGIAGSAPAELAELAGSTIEYTDWGRLDMPAAAEALAGAAPGVPFVHVAHSVGGHFVGFMPNHGRIARHAFVNVGSGYWPKHHRTYNPLELFFWWGLGPWRLATKGYVPTGGGWSGAALPPGVFRTWRRWCHNPRYYADDLAGPLRPHFFEDVRAPIRSWIFTDDPIATPGNAPEILAVYPNAPGEIVVRRPSDFGLKRVGHAEAFRAGREPI